LEDWNYTILFTDGANARTVSGSGLARNQVSYVWDGKSADDSVTFGVTDITVTFTNSSDQFNTSTARAYVDLNDPVLSGIALGNQSSVSSTAPSAFLEVNFSAADTSSTNPSGNMTYALVFGRGCANCVVSGTAASGLNRAYWGGKYSNGTELGEGVYAANLTLFDWAGNPSSASSFNVTVDNTPPSITTNLTATRTNVSANVASNGTVFSFASNSGGSYLLNITNPSNVQVLGLSGAVSAGVLANASWNGRYVAGGAVADGNYNATLIVYDYAGNNASASSPLRIDVDSTPPLISAPLSRTPASVSGLIPESRTTLWFTAQDAQAGMSYAITVVDGLGSTAVITSAAYSNASNATYAWNGKQSNGSLFANGNATVTLNVSDFLGNNATNTAWVMVDNLAPQAINFTCSDFVFSPNASTGVQDNTTFTFYTDENATYVLGIRDTRNQTRTFTGSAVAGNQTSITWGGNSSDGTITFTESVVVLTLTDSLGNQFDYYLKDAGRNRNVTIDDVLPTLTTAVSASPSTFVNTATPTTITANASEHMDNWTLYIYNSTSDLVSTLTAAAGVSLSKQWNATVTGGGAMVPNGNYHANITGQDRAGNTLFPVRSGNITVDNAGVIISVALSANYYYISPNASTGVQDNTTLTFTPNVAGTYLLNVSNVTYFRVFNGSTSGGSQVPNTWNGTDLSGAYMTNSTATLNVTSSGGNSTVQAVNIYVDDEYPSAATWVNATAMADGSVNVNWTNATDNIGVAVYRVHRSTTGGFSASWSNNVANSTADNYNDSSVITGIRYYYLVVAVDAAGNTNASAEANATAAASSPLYFNEDLALSRTLISPNGDGAGDSTTMSFNVTRNATYILTITNTTLTRVITGSCTENVTTNVVWDGKTTAGSVIYGDSTAALTVTDSFGNQVSGTQRTITVDMERPQVTKGLSSDYVSGALASSAVDITFVPDENVSYNVTLLSAPYNRTFYGNATLAERTAVRWNGRDNVNNPFPQETNVTVDMYLTDMAGNTLHDGSSWIIVDNNRPTVTNFTLSKPSLSGFLPSSHVNGSTNMTFYFSENGTYNILVTDGLRNKTITGNTATTGPNVTRASVDFELERDIALNDSARVILILYDGGNASASESHVLSTVNGTELASPRKYSTFSAISGRVSREGLQKLRENRGIIALAYDAPVYISRSDSIPLINADDVWSRQVNGTNSTGANQNICVIDTGVDYTHPDFSGCNQTGFLAGNCSKVIGGYDFVNLDADPMDDHGHGTHCAGIAAGGGNVKGVAPGAKIIAIKVLDSDGSGWMADIASGIDWCTANKTRFNISAISMSLGGLAVYTDATCPADYESLMSAAKSAGIAVVVASGNSYQTTGVSFPACSPYVVPVGSTTKADAISSFSNRGPNLDIVAPGSSINSTVIGGYAVYSGTSMATPHVAGAIALIRQDYLLRNSTTLTPAELETLLTTYGKKIYDATTLKNYTRLDVMAILGNITSLPLPPALPQAQVAATGTSNGSAVYYAWDGKDNDGNLMANGTWTVSLVFNDYAGNAATASSPATLDSTPPQFTSALASSSPTISGVVPTTTNLTFTVNENSTYLINITDPTNASRARTFTGNSTAGQQVLVTWNGRANDGVTPLSSANYTVVARANDSYGNEGNSSVVVQVDNSAAASVTLSASEYYISPNTSPGVKDSTLLTILSPKAGNYTLSIIDLLTPANTRTFTGNILAGTPLAVEWNGRSVNNSVTFNSSRVVATVTDASSNQNSSSPITIYIDDVPPHYTTLFSVNATRLSAAVSSTVNISFAPSEAVTYYVNASLGWQTWSTTGSAGNTTNKSVFWDGKMSNGTWFSDGNATLNVTITDLAGNSNVSSSVNITIDNAAPILTGAFTATPAIVSGALPSGRLNFTFKATDQLATNYTIQVGGSATIGSGAWSTTGNVTNDTLMTVPWYGNYSNNSAMAEGSYTAYLWVDDVARNEATSFIPAVEVDNTAPLTNFTSPANASFAPLTNFTVALNVYDKNPYTVSLNVSNTTHHMIVVMANGSWPGAGNYSNYTGVIDSSWLQNSTYNVTCLVNDTAGNIDNQTTLTLRSDRTPPSIPWVAPPNNSNFSSGTNLTTGITDDWSGVGTVTYSRNNTANATLPFPYNYNTTGLDNGNYNFSVWANDTTGNANYSYFLFNINNSPLTFSLSRPLNLSLYSGDWNETGVPLNYSVGGLGNTVWFKLDGLANQTITSNVTLNVSWPGGLHHLIVYANDTGANLLREERWFFTNASVNTTMWAQAAGAGVTVNVTLANESVFADVGYDEENVTLAGLSFNVAINTTDSWINATNLLAENASWVNNLTVQTVASLGMNVTLLSVVDDIAKMLWVDGFEGFEPYPDDYNATVFLPAAYDSLFYCHGPFNSPTCDALTTTCSAPGNAACFNITSADQTLVYLPHLSGVVGANDSLPPTNQSLLINNGATSTTSASVQLNMTATGAVYCQYSDDNATWSAWQAYGGLVAWTLPGSYGVKTVYGECKDSAGNTAASVNSTITYVEAGGGGDGGGGGGGGGSSGGGGGGGGGGVPVVVEPVVTGFSAEEYSPEAVLSDLSDPEVLLALGGRDAASLVGPSAEARGAATVSRTFTYATEYIFFETNTTLVTVFEFNKSVHDLVIVDELPKEFAGSASSAIVETQPDLGMKVVREDPVFAFEFGDVSGNVTINYTVKKELLSFAMIDMIANMGKPKIFAAAPEKPALPANVTEPAKPQQELPCENCTNASAAPAPACVDDGVCSSTEEALGCADCKKVEAAGIVGFLPVGGAIGVFILIIAAGALIWMRRSTVAVPLRGSAPKPMPSTGAVREEPAPKPVEKPVRPKMSWEEEEERQTPKPLQKLLRESAPELPIEKPAPKRVEEPAPKPVEKPATEPLEEKPAPKQVEKPAPRLVEKPVEKPAVKRAAPQFDSETQRMLAPFESNLELARAKASSMKDRDTASKLSEIVKRQEENMRMLDKVVGVGDKSEIGDALFTLLFTKQEIEKFLR
jgi:subtilisin family serine protease